MERGALTGLEPHALQSVLGPLVGLADVARDHLRRLVPRVLLDAIAGHVLCCSRGGVAGAQGMPRDQGDQRRGVRRAQPLARAKARTRALMMRDTL
jgi:hypothetical protein